MKAPLLIGISYCGTHNKGDEATSRDAIHVTPEEHAEWLLAAVGFWKGVAIELDRAALVIVTAVGLPPILTIPEKERTILWEVMRHVTVIGYPLNPGHQMGAGVALQEGIDAALHWGFPRYFHVTEDVLPWPGVVEKMVSELDAGLDYVGMRWPTGVLNLHMIACRPAALAAFDPLEIRHHKGFEHYFESLIKDCPQRVFSTGEGLYITTHDWKQYRSWLTKMPDETNPIVKRVASDKDWRHFG